MNRGQEQLGVEAVELSAKRGHRELWTDLSFRVRPGRSLAITGPSGCGKSTLLHMIGMLEPVQHGEVLLDGQEVTRMRGRARRALFRDSLGFLFQNFGLEDRWSVRQNLAVALVGSRATKRERSNRMPQLLDRLGLAGTLHTPVHTLSGGEQQRVALVRLLMQAPSIILVDEPTASVDPAQAGVIMEELLRAQASGATLIMATHDATQVERCDSVLELGAVK